MAIVIHKKLNGPCVAEKKTNPVNAADRKYISSVGCDRCGQNPILCEWAWLLTFWMSFSALKDMANMIVPIISCMGIIQDLRRPIDGRNFESTIGDQKSLRE